MQTALKRSIRVMTMVCGWIVLFRVLITFLDRWLLWLLPNEASVAVMGILELTNGCCQLEQIENTGLRFMAASGLLAFGGLCVTMQTVSVTGKLGLGTYLSGKLIQTVISLILSFGIQMLFPAEHRFTVNSSLATALPVILAIFAILLRESEKRGSIPKEIGV